jgi:hypothetical protein
MPKPMLISMIPPVTIGGRTPPVVANSFDSSGNFRSRNGSFKRPRMEAGDGGSRDGYFYLSREPSTACLPNVPKLDVAKIRGLMVKSNDVAMAIRSRMADGSVSGELKELAGLSISLLDLVNAVVEEGILLMVSSPAAISLASVVAGPAATAAPSKPCEEPRTAELKAALTKAEKTAVVFDADLGQSLVANRVTLSGAFAAGLKAATVKVAEESGEDVNEGIRIVNDALSCADDLEFAGQTSYPKIDKRDPANPVTLPFCTMPVRLEFPNRNNRIHFEKTLKKHCDLKATMSLPAPIRKYQALFLNALRERYKIVMVRPDTRSLLLVAFHKEDGVGGWSRCREIQPNPLQHSAAGICSA